MHVPLSPTYKPHPNCDLISVFSLRIEKGSPGGALYLGKYINNYGYIGSCNGIPYI